MYPLTFQADYVEGRSRLTTFFRGIWSFPALIVSSLYGLAAFFAAAFAWFAIIFTGRYPEGLYNFVGGYLRNSTRVNGYYYLLTDAYPPFNGEPDDAYPLRVSIAPAPAKLSRLKAFFKFLIAIPVIIVAYLYLIGAMFCLIFAWLAIVFTGKMPRGLFDFIAKYLAFNLKLSGFLFYMTDEYPPFSVDDAEVQGGGAGPSAPVVSPAGI